MYPYKLWIDKYAATQNKKMVKKKKGCPKFGEIIKKDKAMICNVVLLLAIKETFTRFSPLFSAKNCLKDEITISLIIIIREGIIRNMLLS